MDGIVTTQREAIYLPARLDPLRTALAEATAPEDIRQIENELEALETLMRTSGLYADDQIREVRAERCRARWSLGRALEPIARHQGARTDRTLSRTGTNFRDYLVSLRLDKNRALEAQRIGAMPADEREKVIAAACERGDDPSFAELLIWARPYWYQASRKARHRRIVDAAADRAKPNLRGPFPLIYADPPWKFAVYSDKGLDRTPDQHYPTLTDDEISAFRVDGRPIDKIAHRDAALFLWCTSSNVHRALPIMAAWGFTFKTSAAWDKVRSGTGLVFRNRHELLLYGTRGNMPGPQYQPQSVFVHERGEHSAKPPEIRAEIERMYPDFDARTRLELFARETVAGWTSFGHETDRADSAKPDR